MFLALLAAASLVPVGCQSGLSGACGGGPCGGTSPGVFSRLRSRIFTRPAPAAPCCGQTIGGEAPLEMGAPAVVTPIPGPGATIVTPNSVVPSSPPASSDSTPSELAPIPSNEKTPSAIPEPRNETGSMGTTKPTAGRASYEASGSRSRVSRFGDDLTRATVTTSQPASGSARGSSPSFSEEPTISLLENLPDVEDIRDWHSNEPAPPAEAESVAAPAPKKPEAPPRAEPAPSSVEPPVGAVSATPGFRRFKPVEPKLAGGSLPTKEGLDWLAEKGYKTLLDLREPSEVQASFIADVTSRGLRYVVLPIGLKQVDAEHVSRFDEELALSSSRPLYFCDTDGTRAGVLWYIHQLTVNKIDAQEANREAEELGLADKEYWKAASTYLEGLKAPPASTPAAQNPPAPTSPPAGPSAARVEPKADEVATVAPGAKPLKDIATPPDDDQIKVTDHRDQTSWRSYAALVVTGLGVPLAYISRSAFPSLRTLSRASLPAPEPGPKSLPPGSDG